jgi:GH25 family lysozyme M1 (1,4-beta-N-acetylmuramidase)
VSPSLDFSNNNATGHNFKVAYVKGGQRRMYLKCVEGTHFTDKTYRALRTSALGARFQVGAYDFLRPLQASPTEAAEYFLNRIALPLKHGRDLRPCLDCEYGSPSVSVGRWINETAGIVRREVGARPLMYGSGWWFEACGFKTAPGAL